jgi:hypothetical protein
MKSSPIGKNGVDRELRGNNANDHDSKAMDDWEMSPLERTLVRESAPTTLLYQVSAQTNAPNLRQNC